MSDNPEVKSSEESRSTVGLLFDLLGGVLLSASAADGSPEASQKFKHWKEVTDELVRRYPSLEEHTVRWIDLHPDKYQEFRQLFKNVTVKYGITKLPEPQGDTSTPQT